MLKMVSFFNCKSANSEYSNVLNVTDIYSLFSKFEMKTFSGARVHELKTDSVTYSLAFHPKHMLLAYCASLSERDKDAGLVKIFGYTTWWSNSSYSFLTYLLTFLNSEMMEANFLPKNSRKCLIASLSSNMSGFYVFQVVFHGRFWINSSDLISW